MLGRARHRSLSRSSSGEKHLVLRFSRIDALVAVAWTRNDRVAAGAAGVRRSAAHRRIVARVSGAAFGETAVVEHPVGGTASPRGRARVLRVTRIARVLRPQLRVRVAQGAIVSRCGPDLRACGSRSRRRRHAHDCRHRTQARSEHVRARRRSHSRARARGLRATRRTNATSPHARAKARPSNQRVASWYSNSLWSSGARCGKSRIGMDTAEASRPDCREWRN